MLLRFNGFIGFCCFYIAFSCQSNFLDRVPLGGPSADNFFNNEVELEMGLIGCYKQLNFFGGGSGVEGGGPWPLLLECASDISWQRMENDLTNIGKGSHNAENGFSSGFWTNFYKVIGSCNFLLDNIHNLDGVISDSKLLAIEAEVRSIRAVCYSYLVELFGGVPLVTQTLSLEESKLPRSSIDDVVDFVISELIDVYKLLPEIQPNNGRIGKFVALGYLSRMCLYHEKWDLAEKYSKEIIDSKQYELDEQYRDLFRYENSDSKEIMFNLQYKQGVIVHTTPRTQTLRLAGGVSTIVPFQNTIDKFQMIDGLSISESPLYDIEKPYDNRDPRLHYTIVVPGSDVFGYRFQPHRDSLTTWNFNTTPATVISNTDAINPYATFSGYLWRKYLDERDLSKIRNSEVSVSLLRFAEVLLIYAEAKIENNSIDQSVYNAINLVRGRPSVKMPPIEINKTVDELRSIVRMERLFEFANEGLRLFDLKRWGIAEKMMAGVFYGKPPTDFIRGIPIVDEDGFIDYNSVENLESMRIIETKNFPIERDFMWPIPNIEILTNESMEQNPGY